ncbi:MAG TPA: hypothetical protein VD838_20290 [Anaeromyxobacteraceae bacterium]|nr:hypothetical protein [Anaeromyxobacteraceae bacterium]
MPEQKKRGFHALEERIHQMEEEDQKAARGAAPHEREAPRSRPEDERRPEEKRR